MKVTRDVIMDLYPLYLEGEASADTRRLVEDFLATDSELAQSITMGQRSGLPVPPPGRSGPDPEMAVLRRTKRLVNLRSVLMGLAIFLTLLPFSLRSKGDSIEWIFLSSPRSVVAMLFAASGLWLAHAVVNHRLRGTGV